MDYNWRTRKPGPSKFLDWGKYLWNDKLLQGDKFKQVQVGIGILIDTKN